MDSIPNVSPNYGLYDRKSSKEAIAERRMLREQSGSGPDAVIARLDKENFRLQKELADAQKEIADLKAFRAGMRGDENIRVADNVITWVGRIGADTTGYGPVEFDVCDAGVPRKTNLLSDGFH